VARRGKSLFLNPSADLLVVVDAGLHVVVLK